MTDHTLLTSMDTHTLLAVINNMDDGEIVLDKALQVAGSLKIPIHVLQVIFEPYADFPMPETIDSGQLRHVIQRDAEARLQDLIAATQANARATTRNETHAETDTEITISSSVVWHKYDWQAIIDCAQQVQASLIMKAMAPAHSGLIRKPQDWHLLRHCHQHVMLVTPASWQANPHVMAAVDVHTDGQAELNGMIVKQAWQFAQMLGAELHIVSAFPDLERWLGPISVTIDFHQARKNLQMSTERRIGEITDALGIPGAQIHARQGDATLIIKQMAHSLDAQLLVMGTVQNTGSRGMWLGNTSEQILSQVHCDVAVIVAQNAAHGTDHTD
jgi:universal stress protein E